MIDTSIGSRMTPEPQVSFQQLNLLLDGLYIPIPALLCGGIAFVRWSATTTEESFASVLSTAHMVNVR